jgi:hypothetical protein
MKYAICHVLWLLCDQDDVSTVHGFAEHVTARINNEPGEPQISVNTERMSRLRSYLSKVLYNSENDRRTSNYQRF